MTSARRHSSADYLSLLAGRALGHEPAVVPRVPALFETFRGDGAAGEDGTEIPGELLPQRAPRPGPVEAEIAAPAVVAAATISKSAARPGRMRPAAPEDGPPRRDVRADQRAMVPRAGEALFKPAAIEALTPRQPISVATWPTETNERRLPNDPEDQPKGRGPLPATANDQRRTDLSEMGSTPEQAGMRAAPLPASLAPRVAQLSIAAARPADERRERSGYEAADPAGPTINVTIGRIEVRAVSAPPTVRGLPQPPRRDPPQSLADYLQGRERGR